MNALAKMEQEESVSIARLAYDEAGGDIPAAIEKLTDRVLAEPGIVQLHLREWARAWAATKIRSEIGNTRRDILVSINGGKSFGETLAGAMKSEMLRLMDMPIYGGKRIADATPDEVRESAAKYQEQAKDMALKARWQLMVAAEAEKKSGDTIGKALTEATLVRLWSEADAV